MAKVFKLSALGVCEALRGTHPSPEPAEAAVMQGGKAQHHKEAGSNRPQYACFRSALLPAVQTGVDTHCDCNALRFSLHPIVPCLSVPERHLQEGTCAGWPAARACVVCICVQREPGSDVCEKAPPPPLLLLTRREREQRRTPRPPVRLLLLLCIGVVVVQRCL